MGAAFLPSTFPPNTDLGMSVGWVGAGWLFLPSAHEALLRAVLATFGPQPLLLLTLRQHLRSLLGLLSVPLCKEEDEPGYSLWH